MLRAPVPDTQCQRGSKSIITVLQYTCHHISNNTLAITCPTIQIATVPQYTCHQLYHNALAITCLTTIHLPSQFLHQYNNTLVITSPTTHLLPVLSQYTYTCQLSHLHLATVPPLLSVCVPMHSLTCKSMLSVALLALRTPPALPPWLCNPF